MLEIITAGGWMMFPILLCSAIALAIVAERFWTLRPDRLAPPGLVEQVHEWWNKGQLDERHLKVLRNGSPLGEILAAGVVNAHHGREIMKESIQEERVCVYMLVRVCVWLHVSLWQCQQG